MSIDKQIGHIAKLTHNIGEGALVNGIRTTLADAAKQSVSFVDIDRKDFQSISGNEFLAASYGLLISVVLATIYFIPEGQNQARMTGIIAGSVLLWILVNLIADSGSNFDLSVNLEPPFLYKFDFDLSLTPPILLWAFLSLSGFVYWNCESNQDKELEAEA